jgi:hypothetical protein
VVIVVAVAGAAGEPLEIDQSSVATAASPSLATISTGIAATDKGVANAVVIVVAVAGAAGEPLEIDRSSVATAAAGCPSLAIITTGVAATDKGVANAEVIVVAVAVVGVAVVIGIGIGAIVGRAFVRSTAAPVETVLPSRATAAIPTRSPFDSASGAVANAETGVVSSIVGVMASPVEVASDTFAASPACAPNSTGALPVPAPGIRIPIVFDPVAAPGLPSIRA